MSLQRDNTTIRQAQEQHMEGEGQPMDIRKSNNNFRDKKLKCFNCNKYRHMVKECQSKKKEDKR